MARFAQALLVALGRQSDPCLADVIDLAQEPRLTQIRRKGAAVGWAAVRVFQYDAEGGTLRFQREGSFAN